MAGQPGERPNLGRVDELIELINQVAGEAPPPETSAPIKLTAWQRDQLPRIFHRTEAQYAFLDSGPGSVVFGGRLGDLLGRPIELVDRAEDSDLPDWRPTPRGLHPDVVIYDEVVAWPADPGLSPAEFLRREFREGRLVTKNGLPARPGWIRRLRDRLFG